MKPVKIGLLGLGTVGGGTVSILQRNAEEIQRRAGRGIEIAIATARDVNKSRPFDMSNIELTTDSKKVVDHPDVDVVVELIGGTDDALDLVMRAIENGKHVVTANKALIAKHGNEIFAAADAKGVIVAYEAAVAGGIPIIKAVREGLSANKIEWLAGIINGTGNFILTEMRDNSSDFSDVLDEAQRLGYAEADPTFDVEGIDAAHKLTILASNAFGIPLQLDKAFTEGITKITREDVEYAEKLGYRIKHLGISRRTEKGIELRVHPTLIPERRLIANVDGVMNAVLIQGDAVGPTLYYGPGAGAEPTASSVIADLVDVVRGMGCAVESRVPALSFQADAIKGIAILPMEEVETSYYLRMLASDCPGVMADLTKILGDHSISIEAILQQEPVEGESSATIIMLTHKVQEKNMNSAIIEIQALKNIEDDVTRIRMEALG